MGNKARWWSAGGRVLIHDRPPSRYTSPGSTSCCAVLCCAVCLDQAAMANPAPVFCYDAISLFSDLTTTDSASQQMQEQRAHWCQPKTQNMEKQLCSLNRKAARDFPRSLSRAPKEGTQPTERVQCGAGCSCFGTSPCRLRDRQSGTEIRARSPNIPRPKLAAEIERET